LTTSTIFFEPTDFRQLKQDYVLLPFRFKRLKSSVFLTNIVGEYSFLSFEDFSSLIENKLTRKSSCFEELLSKQFIATKQVDFDLLASKLWTKKSFLAGFTKLHIFVLTLRCNNSCTYCQASRQNVSSSTNFDMSIDTARASVRLMMQSPCPSITVEFQGGEPLLNFPALKEIVLYSKKLNQEIKKSLSFVVCTNASLLNEEILNFFKEHDVGISTSIDGPQHLHDNNRCRSIKEASYSVVVPKIKEAQKILGPQKISALMTTTKESLGSAKEIIDKYLELGIGSIFIRSLNPYGFAVKTGKSIGYSVEEFIEFYKNCFEYIIEINKSGTVFPEIYTTLLLRKILTPWPVGFVDLQSPTGNGFAVTVYNYDGDVYASDESRMLAEMGDSKFRLGNVFSDTYEKIYFSEPMQELCIHGVAECLAGCADCAYVPYCGADPVRHYATQKDSYGNRSTSEFCKKNKGILDYLFNFLATADKETLDIVWSWIRDTPINEVKTGEEKNAS